MADLAPVVLEWGEAVVWAIGGLVLLVRYRRHPRSARRGLAAVAVWFALVLPLTVWPVPFQTALAPYRLYQCGYVLTSTLAYLLLAWAAVTGRPPCGGRRLTSGGAHDPDRAGRGDAAAVAGPGRRGGRAAAPPPAKRAGGRVRRAGWWQCWPSPPPTTRSACSASGTVPAGCGPVSDTASSRWPSPMGWVLLPVAAMMDRRPGDARELLTRGPSRHRELLWASLLFAAG